MRVRFFPLLEFDHLVLVLLASRRRVLLFHHAMI
jgi:hypothetical protein